MNLRTIASRAAVAGVSTALAAGALVGATATTANAVDSDYTCAVPLLGDKTFPMTVDAFIPAQAPTGTTIPDGLLTMTASITAPADVAGMLGNFKVDGAKILDYAMKAGPMSVPAALTLSEPVTHDDGSATFSGSGTNAKFTTPAPGKYAVKLPGAFTLTPTVQGEPLVFGGSPITVSCSNAAPATLTTVTITKQSATMTAKGPKTVKKGKPAVIVATVKGAKLTATGKVVAKEGKKALGSAALKKGKATLSLKKLKPGKHTITVSYAGDKFTAAAKSVKVTFTVKK